MCLSRLQAPGYDECVTARGPEVRETAIGGVAGKDESGEGEGNGGDDGEVEGGKSPCSSLPVERRSISLSAHSLTYSRFSLEMAS